ncbi:MAG: hypothetical protein R3B53_01115 [Candidatus Paceibacterota bacterium]
MKTDLILGGIVLVCVGGVAGYMIASSDWYEGREMHDSMHEHMEDDDRSEVRDTGMLGGVEEVESYGSLNDDGYK